MRELFQRAVPLLLEWYRIHKRTLPWRGERDPYKVLVSEIMLQQTRVEAVKGYYARFLEQFPTPAALAAASEEEVLKAWEGLGYYSRARNLKKAAEEIAKNGFPRSFEGVRRLAGVGDYTAGAVCSIALGLPCPAVDGNVLRVLTRLFADGRNIGKAETKGEFSALLTEHFPPETADFTQALMELGALVCLPNGKPQCEICPWQTLCRAHLAGEEENYPVKSEKAARKIERLDVFVLKHNNKFALTKREKKGLLAGLYSFPLFPAGDKDVSSFGKVLKKKSAKHIFTHVEWHMTGYLIEATEETEGYLWASAEEIFARYALPSAFKAFLTWIEEKE